jgi:hypothetical protein
VSEKLQLGLALDDGLDGELVMLGGGGPVASTLNWIVEVQPEVVCPS